MQMLIKTKQFVLICCFTFLTGCSEPSLDNTQNKEPPDEPGINEDSSNTIEDLKFRADNGNASAMVKLSDEYYEGTKVSEDLEASFKYAKLAADLEDPDGLATLGEFYRFAVFVEEDLQTAFELYQTAAVKNSARGQYNLGAMHEDGDGVEEDFEKANFWYRQAIVNGATGEAQFALANNLIHGDGEPKNYKEALRLAEQAIEIGYSWAHFLVATIYTMGYGVDINLTEARSHLKICSDDGDQDCKYYYALNLQLPTSKTSQTTALAVQLMRELADEGYVSAIIQLGLWFDDGHNVARDNDQAFSLYEKGAALGDRRSTGLLATMYRYGEGVEKDIEKALELLWEAAELGDIQSLLWLSEIYRDGIELDRDLEKYEGVLKSAASLGSTEAMITLAQDYESGFFGEANHLDAKRLLDRVLAEGDESDRNIASRMTKRLLKIKATPRDSFSGVDFGQYKALVIGIDGYEKLNPLRTSINDAQSIANTLREHYSFEVELLINPTRSSLLDALIKYRETLIDSDNFLLFYAGHGILQPGTGKGFWQPADSDPIFETNWIAIDFITSIIKTLKARNTMIIADSCYSGAVFRSGITTADSRFMEPSLVKRMLEAETRVALTSGGLEPVIDSVNQGDENSIFTRALIKALSEEAPVTTGSEVFSKVASAVISETTELGFKQTPEYAGLSLAGHEGGDFVFRRAQK